MDPSNHRKGTTRNPQNNLRQQKRPREHFKSRHNGIGNRDGREILYPQLQNILSRSKCKDRLRRGVSFLRDLPEGKTVILSREYHQTCHKDRNRKGEELRRAGLQMLIFLFATHNSNRSTGFIVVFTHAVPFVSDSLVDVTFIDIQHETLRDLLISISDEGRHLEALLVHADS